MRVARRHSKGTTREQLDHDFGIHPMMLSKWLRHAAIDHGERPGASSVESVELRREESDPPVGEGERGVAPCHRGLRPGVDPNRMLHRLVCERAADGIPVTVSRRALSLVRAPYYRTRDSPFTDARLDEAPGSLPGASFVSRVLG